MRQVSEIASSRRTIKAEVRGRALTKKNNDFKTCKAGSQPKPSGARLFTAAMPEQAKPRKASFTREQAKSLLLSKRDAYLTGKLSCRVPVVKSLIKQLVDSMSTTQEGQA